MSAAHTPGSWGVGYPRSNEVEVGGRRIAICVQTAEMGDLDKDQADANAEFIVRAVNAHDELLEALIAIAPELRGLGLVSKHCADLSAQVDAAIAKATGEGDLS